VAGYVNSFNALANSTSFKPPVEVIGWQRQVFREDSRIFSAWMGPGRRDSRILKKDPQTTKKAVVASVKEAEKCSYRTSG
jgi:hypothetical protein